MKKRENHQNMIFRDGTRLPSECDYLQKKLEFMAIINE